MVLSGKKTIGTSISLRKETTRSLHKSNPRRPIRTSATVVADIRIDRRGCAYRSLRMVLQGYFHRLLSAALLQLHNEHAVAELLEVECLTAHSELLSVELLTECVVHCQASRSF